MEIIATQAHLPQDARNTRLAIQTISKIIIIIIILSKLDYKIQLAIIKIQMAWLTSWLVVG